jgi:hypothetical protein
MNETLIEENWSPKPLVECYKLQVIGGYCTILFIVGIIANPTIIWIILRNKELVNPVNILIVALSILNTIGVLVELPLVTISAFMCRFKFGKLGCYWEAFLMFFIGCSTIFILTSISCMRFYIIKIPHNSSLRVINRILMKLILISCVLGLVFSLMPILGWSEYSLEGAMISCSIEWNKRTPSVLSFIFTFAFFVYLIPLCTLIYTNLKIFFIVRCSTLFLFKPFFSKVRSSKKRLVGANNQIKKKQITEFKLSIRLAILISILDFNF